LQDGLLRFARNDGRGTLKHAQNPEPARDDDAAKQDRAVPSRCSVNKPWRLPLTVPKALGRGAAHYHREGANHK